jgi:hypothetical protein
MHTARLRLRYRRASAPVQKFGSFAIEASAACAGGSGLTKFIFFVLIHFSYLGVSALACVSGPEAATAWGWASVPVMV